MISVLIVDDQDVDRFLLKSLLTTIVPTFHKNVIIHEAGSGMEAVEMCQTAQFDLIFLDAIMPNLNGFETAKQIREYDKDAVIVGISSLHDRESQHIMIESGADHFIEKPIYADVLTPVLKSIISIIEQRRI